MTRGNQPSSLARAVEAAEMRHTRLVLVIGGSGEDASQLIAEFGRAIACRVANVSLIVAEMLLNIPTRQRPVAAADAAADLIRSVQPGQPSLLDHLQVLFLPELKLDPLKLLSDSARSRVVIAAWPGERSGASLRYAVPSHPEFREYHNPDCLVVEAAPSSTKGRS